MEVSIPIRILLITLVILFASSWNDGNGGVAGGGGIPSVPTNVRGKSAPGFFEKLKRKGKNTRKSTEEHIHQLEALIKEYAVKMAVAKQEDKFTAIRAGVPWYKKEEKQVIPMFEHARNVMEVAIYYRDLLKALHPLYAEQQPLPHTETHAQEIEGLTQLENMAETSSANNPTVQNDGNGGNEAVDDGEIQQEVDDQFKQIETDVGDRQNTANKKGKNTRLNSEKRQKELVAAARKEAKIYQDKIIREALDGRLTLEEVVQELQLKHSIANDAARKLKFKDQISRIKIEAIDEWWSIAGQVKKNVDTFTAAIVKEENPVIVEDFFTKLGEFANHSKTQFKQNFKTVQEHLRTIRKVPEVQGQQ